MALCSRFIHGMVRTQFEQQHDALRLIARARQFSSFMLLLGKIGPAADEFQPEHAIILSNKDEIQIPLVNTTACTRLLTGLRG